MAENKTLLTPSSPRYKPDFETPPNTPERTEGGFILFTEPKITEIFGGLTFDEDTKEWTRCFPCTSDGKIAWGARWGPAFRPLESGFSIVSRSTGKLTNIASGCNESGVCISRRTFLTALHFQVWAVRHNPTVAELNSLLGRRDLDLYVSFEIVHEDGPSQDPNAIQVELIHYDISRDYALFAPVEPFKEFPCFVTLDAIIEENELQQTIQMDDLIVACGYNGIPSHDEITAWTVAYTKQLSPDSKKVAEAQNPNPSYILLPNRKTVTVGKIKGADEGEREIHISAPLWKGFSGASVMFPPRSGSTDLKLIGLIVGGLMDGKWNRAKTFENGFRDQIRSVITTHESRRVML